MDQYEKGVIPLKDLLARLVLRDMMGLTQQEATDLVAYANKEGYQAETFVERRKHYVCLKRGGKRRPIDYPIRWGVEEPNGNEDGKK